MMRMEVDMQSPSLRPSYGFSSSSKRARSPDESNSPSRPSKRPTLSTGNVHSSAYPEYTFCGSSSAGSSRHTSEDWVQQASGLTIDSPLFPGAQTPPLDHSMANEQLMQIPLNAAQPEPYGRPHLAPLQTSFSPTTLDIHAAPKPASQQDLSQFAAVNGYTQQAVPPSINVLPPTPDVSFPIGYTAVSRSSTPIHDSPMSISSSPSSATTPTRKKRFTMGPRADCVKCRMGVKGHWMHLD